MPQEWTIDIDQEPGQPYASFKPQNLGADPTDPVAPGDLIFWRNNTENAHWPTPVGQPGWFDYQIPGKLPGQPAPTSPSISFGEAMEVQYVCALHLQETGTIKVT